MIEPLAVRPALQVEYPTVNRRLKGDRLPLPQTSPASSGSGKLAAAAADRCAVTRPAHLRAGLGPRRRAPGGSKLERAGAPIKASESLHDRPRAARQCDRHRHPDVRRAERAPPMRTTTTKSSLADKPPEIPAPARTVRSMPSRRRSPTLSFLDEDPAERSAQLYFGRGSMGSPQRAGALGAGRRAGSGVCRPSIRTSKCRRWRAPPTIPGAAARPSPARTTSAAWQTPGGAARPCRQAARQGGKMSRRRGLFRSPRRAVQGQKRWRRW